MWLLLLSLLEVNPESYPISKKLYAFCIPIIIREMKEEEVGAILEGYFQKELRVSTGYKKPRRRMIFETKF